MKRYTWGYLQSKEPSQIPVLNDTVYDMSGSISSYLGSLTVAINPTETLFRDYKGLWPLVGTNIDLEVAIYFRKKCPIVSFRSKLGA